MPILLFRSDNCCSSCITSRTWRGDSVNSCVVVSGSREHHFEMISPNIIAIVTVIKTKIKNAISSMRISFQKQGEGENNSPSPIGISRHPFQGR